MALTCLELIQQVCLRVGIQSPNAVVTSTDQQVLQLLALCNEEARELARKYQWQSLNRESTFVTVATELQGSLDVIAPGLKFVINSTLWNRTTRLPVLGPESAQDWQQMVAMYYTSPYSRYRIKDNALYMFPIPADGHTCTFEYNSKNWVSTLEGGTADLWTNDEDTSFLEDDLLMLGTLWRWKAEKGLDYSENFVTYQAMLEDCKSMDGSKPILSTGSSAYQFSLQPGVFVPAGSWPV